MSATSHVRLREWAADSGNLDKAAALIASVRASGVQEAHGGADRFAQVFERPLFGREDCLVSEARLNVILQLREDAKREILRVVGQQAHPVKQRHKHILGKLELGAKLNLVLRHAPLLRRGVRHLGLLLLRAGLALHAIGRCP